MGESNGTEKIVFESWSCPVCGETGAVRKVTAADYNYRIPGKFTFAQCAQCGLWRQQPRPTAETLGNAYPLHYGSSPAVKLNPESRITCYANRKRFMLMRSAVRKNASVFDIGCGSGFFLAYLKRRKWRVAGIDSAEEHVKFANSELGLEKVKAAQWPGYENGNEKYDAVSLIHVLEHLPDPVEGLRAAGKMLDKGGYLLVETPNINALARYVYGGRCNLFDAPRHLCLYSRKTIDTCVREAGFTPVKLITYSPSLDGYRESLRYLVQDGKMRSYRTETVAPGRSHEKSASTDSRRETPPVLIFHTLEKTFFRFVDSFASRFGGGLTLLMLARKE